MERAGRVWAKEGELENDLRANPLEIKELEVRSFPTLLVIRALPPGRTDKNQVSPMLRGLAYLFRQWEYSASSPKRLPLLSCVDVFVESLWAACGLRALQAASCTCAEIAEAVQLFMRARPALNRSQHGLANTLTRHRARTSLGTAAIVPPRSLWRHC